MEATMDIKRWIGKVPISIFALALWGAQGLEADPKRFCKEDAKKYCRNVERGEGRIMKCLEENRSRLSADCGRQIDRKRAFQSACGSDVETHCSGVRHERGKIRSCMRENRDKLSDVCRSFLKEKKEKRKRREREGEGKGY